MHVSPKSNQLEGWHRVVNPSWGRSYTAAHTFEVRLAGTAAVVVLLICASCEICGSI